MKKHFIMITCILMLVSSMQAMAYPVGDLDYDYHVTIEDINILVAEWLNGCTASNGWCDGADITQNGIVNLFDFSALAANWLKDAISDHVYKIEIETGIDYSNPNLSGDTSYEFALEVNTDQQVQRIEFIPPAGGHYELTKDELWEYGEDFTTAAGFNKYGDGEYQFIITLDNGDVFETSVWFTIPGTSNPIPQPTQVPTYTTISNGSVLSSPITLSWVPCTEPNLYMINVSATNTTTWEDLLDEVLPGIATELGRPVYLDKGKYEIDLGFNIEYFIENADGIPVELLKWNESDYLVTIITP